MMVMTQNVAQRLNFTVTLSPLLDAHLGYIAPRLSTLRHTESGKAEVCISGFRPNGPATPNQSLNPRGRCLLSMDHHILAASVDSAVEPAATIHLSARLLLRGRISSRPTSRRS